MQLRAITNKLRLHFDRRNVGFTKQAKIGSYLAQEPEDPSRLGDSDFVLLAAINSILAEYDKSRYNYTELPAVALGLLHRVYIKYLTQQMELVGLDPRQRYSLDPIRTFLATDLKKSPIHEANAIDAVHLQWGNERDNTRTPLDLNVDIVSPNDMGMDEPVPLQLEALQPYLEIPNSAVYLTFPSAVHANQLVEAIQIVEVR
jgi:hypothetical protein